MKHKVEETENKQKKTGTGMMKYKIEGGETGYKPN